MEKHGAYVWRKSEFSATVNRTVTNPSYNASLNTNTYVLTITLTGITILQQGLNDFLVGFTLYSPAGNNAGTFKYSGGQLILDAGAIVRNATATISGQTITVTFSGSITWVGASGQAYAKYAGDKVYKEYNVIGDFIDFVVSDIESAYPDGGLKDGYWYERAENGPYKTTSGSVTIIDTASEITIEHGLGEVPKAYLIARLDYSWNATVTVAYPICYSSEITSAYIMRSGGSGKSMVSNIMDAEKITAYAYDSTYAFKTGTYVWMALA